MSTEAGRLRSVATGGDHPDMIAADAARTHYAAAATPTATTRAYSEAWEAFHTCCGTVGLASLPADPVTVERYIALGAVRKDLAASTLAVWIAAIADRHHDVGHPDLTTGEKVREVLAGVRTTQTLAGTGRRPTRHLDDPHRLLHARPPHERNRRSHIQRMRSVWDGRWPVSDSPGGAPRRLAGLGH